MSKAHTPEHHCAHCCPQTACTCPLSRPQDPETPVTAVNRLIADLARSQRELAEFYGPLDILPWLRAPHALLKGDRAIDLLGTDRAPEVWDVLDQMKSGAYV